MSSSPLRSGSDSALAKESPSRFQSRYAERYKSILESPPREPSSSSFTSKNSPLRPNNPQHKIFDTEKYSNVDVINPDQGEWREIKIKKETEFSTVSASPVRQESPSPKPSHEKRPSATPPPREPQVIRSHRVPHYMQATKSFHEKVSSRKEGLHADNILRPRTKGGITKRVGTSKIPRYQTTTSINAVQDIQSEMAPDDVYVPMAARIKLFEKGLGNGSNKPAPIVPKYSRSNSMNSHHSHSPTPSANTSRPSSTASHRRTTPSRSESTDRIPNYLRQTSSSSFKQKAHHAPESTSPQLQPQTLTKKKSQVKPFQFATSKRAEEHDSSFNDKLNLWKVKDKQAIEHNNKNRGIKRKNTAPDTSPQKHNRN